MPSPGRLAAVLPHVAAAMRGALGELTRNALAAASPYVPLPSVVGAVVAGGRGVEASSSRRRVVAIHCIAGKGRTGMVCSALLLHQGWAGDSVLHSSTPVPDVRARRATGSRG